LRQRAGEKEREWGRERPRERSREDAGITRYAINKKGVTYRHEDETANRQWPLIQIGREADRQETRR